MKKLLMFSGLAGAGALPFTADAYGFGHFGRGGGMLGGLLVVALVVAVLVMVTNTHRN
jgi:hypothetical protein